MSARSGQAGRDPQTALRIAAATSGRAMIVSGVTVCVAMAGMLFTGLAEFEAMGLASLMVVAVAMVGSVTVLPALLSLLGERVEKGRIPFLPRRAARRTGARQPREPVLDGRAEARARPAGALGRRRGRRAAGRRRSRGRHEDAEPHAGPGVRRLAADRADVQPRQRGLPRRLRPGRGGGQGRRHQRARGDVRARRLPGAGGRFGASRGPVEVTLHDEQNIASSTSRWSAAPTTTRRARAWTSCATRCGRTRSARSTASRRRHRQVAGSQDFNDQLAGASSRSSRSCWSSPSC